MRSIYLAPVVAFALAAPTAAADPQPNPLFASWSKFQPGATVTMASSSTIGAGFTKGVTLTTTLREVGADKLVLEASGTARINDLEGPIESTKTNVPKAAEKDAKDDARVGGKPEGTFEEGTETLTVGKAKVKVEARWYKFRSEADGVKTEGKVWVSDAVPGGVVRQELTRVSGVVTDRQTSEVIEIKMP